MRAYITGCQTRCAVIQLTQNGYPFRSDSR